MSIKPDSWIIKMAKECDMIRPFSEDQVKKGVISFGPSSYGYDIRIADEFKLYKGNAHDVIDPKNIDQNLFENYTGREVIIPANSFCLGRSVEYFKIPREILVICSGKSTYCRCGIIVNVSPLEPEWEGYLTISIINASPSSVKLHANEGIGQILFLEAAQICQSSYKDKKGKYDKQTEITLAR